MKRLTSVEAWDLVLEIEEGWSVFKAVLLLLRRTVNAHERNALLVAFIVDVLQIGQGIQTVLFGAVV